MYVDQNNWEDAKKYFHQTYVKFKEEGDKIFYITRVDPNLLVAEDSSHEEIGIDLTKGYTIEYVIPKKTTFQLSENALYLSRIPARMWKKGLNKSNTQFQILQDGWKSYEFNINIIEGFVNKPTYFRAEDAVNDFLKSDHLKSAALSPRMSMSRNGSVYLDTVMIGKMDLKKGNVITKKLFENEVKKVFSMFTTKVLNGNNS